MAAFASADWIDDLSAAAADLPCDPSLRLVVEQRVTDPDATWHVTLDAGTVRVVAGPADAPSITLSSTRATAAAIHAGTLSAQRAFLDGELRIGGDVHALIEHRDAIALVAGGLRAVVPPSAT